MLRHITLFAIITILLAFDGWGQPWVYNFGTEVWSLTSSTSSTFLPATQSGGGSRYARIGTGGGSINFQTTLTGFSKADESCLRGVAPTGTSINKFSIYDYTAGKVATMSFRLRFGNTSGASGPSSGTWYFFLGDGSTYNDANTFSGAQVFVGLKFSFGASGAIACSTRVGGSWVQPFPSAFSQGINYLVDIVANNSTSTANYGTDTVAANKYDIYVNGTKVGDGVGKATLPNDSNIDSFMFYGESSTGNVANIFIDDIVYSN